MFFNRLDAFRWRDPTDMNELVLRSSFPEVTMEFRDDWDDRIKMGVPFVFERVVLADRSAAMRAYNYQRYQRTAAVPFGLPGSGWILTTGARPPPHPSSRTSPRQAWGRRILLQEDHEKLVQELYRLRDEHGWEVNVVLMEKISRAEQIQLAVRTTIMMGVHGNGLTNLIWMRPTPRTTVMEFFYPGGFAHDYEYTARALGISHYGFWGNESASLSLSDVADHHLGLSPVQTFPSMPTPKGFKVSYITFSGPIELTAAAGSSIPIDAATVGRLVYDRLTLSLEVDD
ncbi:hypothetical protein MSAN_01363400 [Mycena sanguinolenta]|uniref:Glycosyltransferase 61 catalytic domain-containing protein n=1 Tax=Mycena sanguinolenta TaxID=230812 RepID=A0A8H6YDE9_9AGAR|nr:hypothetical protein MSAN_01363400 [Mycena sanguinolenta]